MSTPAQLGLFVPLTAKPSEATALSEFLLAGHTLVQNEPETLQWFAIKYTSPPLFGQNPTPDTPPETQFLIFDTFAADAGRQAHLAGPIAAALMKNREALLVEGDAGVAIQPIQLLAHKVTKPAGDASGVTQGLQVGLRVIFTAKADKIDAVKEHLITVGKDTLEEDSPPLWFGFWFPGTNKFGILGLGSEADREARLTGPAATKMRENSGGLFEGPPEVINVDIVAAKF
ncbi:hypothetical protein EUX98_g4154 [Antrodiella citrinella]|uniref:ABM domain-containing protein n=1 Tax=Antrodiella citrinella TaxID=2447956 RepID=A0A4S4MUQ4_9APHY|nr:hypothetical protein EUX98_g4154 [Antrodiella citrinella]